MTAAAVAPTRTGRVGGVAYAVLGSGGPVTVLAHGLGGSAAETRPLAARLPGTRVLLSFRGHGDSAPSPEGGWDYDCLAEDLLAVADAVGADRAVGLSLGAGALLRLLSEQPERFARLGLVLPAALDSARVDGATVRLRLLGDAIDAGDVARAAELLLEELPGDVRDRRGVAALLTRRAADLVSRPAPRPAGEDRPLADRAVLQAVTAPALVVGQAGDPLHDIALAGELARALPCARLLALPPGGVFWTASRQVQDALAAHLAPEAL